MTVIRGSNQGSSIFFRKYPVFPFPLPFKLPVSSKSHFAHPVCCTNRQFNRNDNAPDLTTKGCELKIQIWETFSAVQFIYLLPKLSFSGHTLFYGARSHLWSSLLVNMQLFLHISRSVSHLDKFFFFLYGTSCKQE